MHTFIFVDVEVDHTKSVFQTISRFEGVNRVYMIMGEHDIIVDVESGDIKELYDSVLSRIRAVDGVLKTVTSIVI